MSAGEQGPQRGKREASHAASVAQKLVCWLAAAACSCDGGTAEPPVDPDDIDGDGLPNEQDLCPAVKDPAQHDEDGDGVGDPCDVCPTVADPLQADQGELDSIAFDDGVGDACDPRPSRGGDRIGALHAFAVDNTPAWRGAGWAIADDRASASGSGAARWQHASSVTGDGLTARLAIESVVWAMAGGSVAVAVDGDGVESGRSCALVADRDGDGRDELEVHELGGVIAVRELTAAVTGPVQLVVQRGVERRTGTGVVYCTAFLPDRPDEAITTSIPTSDDTTTGQYVFSAADAEVSVTSLIVYGSPIACPAVGLRACNRP